MECASAYYHLVRIRFECMLSEQITKLIYGIIPKFVIQGFQVLADGHGWVLDEYGHLVYEWTKEEIMPQTPD